MLFIAQFHHHVILLEWWFVYCPHIRQTCAYFMIWMPRYAKCRNKTNPQYPKMLFFVNSLSVSIKNSTLHELCILFVGFSAWLGSKTNYRSCGQYTIATMQWHSVLWNYRIVWIWRSYGGRHERAILSTKTVKCKCNSRSRFERSIARNLQVSSMYFRSTDYELTKMSNSSENRSKNKNSENNQINVIDTSDQNANVCMWFFFIWWIFSPQKL